MTDLEITRLCAQAMGYAVLREYDDGALAVDVHLGPINGVGDEFDPLHDYAQSIALLKTLHLQIGKTLRTSEHPFGLRFASQTSKADSTSSDLLRAICECVAMMQLAKGAPERP